MNKQRSHYIDMSVGFFMLFSFIALLFMVMKVSGITTWTSSKTYTVTAEFSDIGGLKVNAPVTIAGVKIGKVTSIKLDAGQLNAKVTMKLNRDQPIPYEDASARILTEGLLGANYVSIVPGFGEDNQAHPYLRSGDVIAKTQEAIILENLIGQLLFNIKK